MFRIFMSIKSYQSESALWTFFLKRILIQFISNLIYKRVRSYLVYIWAVCAMPCYRNPFSFSFYAFILIKFYCLRTTFRTLFFNTLHRQQILSSFYFTYINMCLILKIHYPKQGSFITILLLFLNLLSAQILPRCFSIICLATYSPRPVPSVWTIEVPLPRENFWNK